MTQRLFRHASLAASLLLPALTGCVFHKVAPPPVAAIAPTPEPPPAPLYISELSQGALLPDLPDVPPPNAQPAPPPQSEIELARAKRPVRKTRGHKGEIELAERESREKESHEKEAAPASGNNATDAGTNTAETATPPVEKVTAPVPNGDTAQPTALGPLTAGPSQDADASKNQASDLIQNTQRGVNSLHRSLSGDQEKTVTQIRSFLQQAQRAMHNGDVDGAYTLATKAKLLLDELNGAT